MSDFSHALAQQFIEALPHSKALAMRIEEISEGKAAISLPWNAQLVGDPHTGVLHGGAISALMDTTSGTAVMTLPQGFGTATLDLRIDYMRAATPGQTVIALAECYHVTRSVAFARTTAYDDDRQRPVATANGAFTYGHGAAPRTAGELGQAMELLEARKKELGL